MPIDRTSHLTAQIPEKNVRRRSFYRSFIQFLCSNLGLIIVVVGYSIGGAFLFILLEGYVELQDCQEASLQENVSVSNISESIFNYVAITTDNDTIMYQQIVTYFENFTNGIYDRKNNYRYTGQNCITSPEWTFCASLLFAITVITSIGYGFIAPVTWEGQITCICYALIGIPIFLLCLANISSILGDIFRFVYSILLRCICCCCRIYGRNKRRQNSRKKSSNEQDMEYVGATTVDPSWPEAHHQHHVNRENFNDYEDDSDEDLDDEIDEVWRHMENRVPILVVMAVIVGYIYLGAIMFSNTEGWTILISVYFCYISLATIGFGDYVPGITSNSTSGIRFLGACLYIVIGLAILAMCFDLIKESIVDKVEWLGYKFGFIHDGDNQIDEGPIEYANFQYFPQREINDNRTNQFSASPPAYDYAYTTDGQWSTEFKDKV